jgi:hypothetical protein
MAKRSCGDKSSGWKGFYKTIYLFFCIFMNKLTLKSYINITKTPTDNTKQVGNAWQLNLENILLVLIRKYQIFYFKACFLSFIYKNIVILELF